MQEITQNVANVFSFYATIAIEHCQCINNRHVPWEVLKTAAPGLGFQHLPQDLANGKPCLIPMLSCNVYGVCPTLSTFSLSFISRSCEFGHFWTSVIVASPGCFLSILNLPLCLLLWVWFIRTFFHMNISQKTRCQFDNSL